MPFPTGPSRNQSFKGSGLAILRSHPGPAQTLGCTFTHLHFSFPLKLIHPRTSGKDAALLLAKAAAAKRRIGNGNSDGEGDGEVTEPKAIAVLYIVGYGGGLVSGDDVELDVDVGERCTLLLLTQGSTKVFKMRATPSSSNGPSSSIPPFNGSPSRGQLEAPDRPITRQYTRFLIRPHSTLVLLPDPVTCYASSRYAQAQRFDVQCAHTSSLVLLDWFTPGRQHLLRSSGDSTSGTQSEAWRFQSYRSRNEVRVEGQVVIRDVLLLEQDETQCSLAGEGATTDLGRRNHPYSCYANLFLLGPDVQPLVARLNDEFQSIQQRVVPSSHRGGAAFRNSTAANGNGASASATSPQAILWSLTILNEDSGSRDQAQIPSSSAGGSASASSSSKQAKGGRQAVVRIAGLDTEGVRNWLKQRLTPLEGVVGQDLYKQAMW